MPAKLENSAMATRLEEVSFHSNPKERQCQRMFQLFYGTTALISHASKLMLKILKARYQQYVNCDFPDVQAGFRKGRENRDQIALVAQTVKCLPTMQETWVRSLGWEDPLEKVMATHSSTLTWTLNRGAHGPRSQVATVHGVAKNRT